MPAAMVMTLKMQRDWLNITTKLKNSGYDLSKIGIYPIEEASRNEFRTSVNEIIKEEVKSP